MTMRKNPQKDDDIQYNVRDEALPSGLCCVSPQAVQRHSFGPGVEVPRDMQKWLYVYVKCMKEIE